MNENEEPEVSDVSKRNLSPKIPHHFVVASPNEIPPPETEEEARNYNYYKFRNYFWGPRELQNLEEQLKNVVNKEKSMKSFSGSVWEKVKPGKWMGMLGPEIWYGDDGKWDDGGGKWDSKYVLERNYKIWMLTQARKTLYTLIQNRNNGLSLNDQMKEYNNLIETLDKEKIIYKRREKEEERERREREKEERERKERKQKEIEEHKQREIENWKIEAERKLTEGGDHLKNEANKEAEDIRTINRNTPNGNISDRDIQRYWFYKIYYDKGAKNALDYFYSKNKVDEYKEDRKRLDELITKITERITGGKSRRRSRKRKAKKSRRKSKKRKRKKSRKIRRH